MWFVCKGLRFCGHFASGSWEVLAEAVGHSWRMLENLCMFFWSFGLLFSPADYLNLLSESNQAYDRGAQTKLGKQFCIYPLGPLLVGPEMISSHELSNPEHIPGTCWCIFCSAESCQHFIRKKRCSSLCDCFAQRSLRDVMDLNRSSLEVILPKLAKENFTVWDTVYESSFFRVP